MSLPLFLVIWVFLVPAAVARMAKTVAQEEVFEGVRAWVEARFPDGLLDYGIGCTTCLSHWGAGILTLAFAQKWVDTALWTDLPVWCSIPVAFVAWLSATEIAVRFWVGKQ